MTKSSSCFDTLEVKGLGNDKAETFAVHRQKLKQFIERLGLLESLIGGELLCQICGEPVTLDSIGFIVPSGQEILFCCTQVDCTLRVTELERRATPDET